MKGWSEGGRKGRVKGWRDREREGVWDELP